jgi:replication-associated recombination protein RarA
MKRKAENLDPPSRLNISLPSLRTTYSRSRKRRRKKQRIQNAPTANSIKDLIEIANTGIEYTNINTEALWKIKHQLEDIEKMIGMKELKDSLFDQIIFYVQNLGNEDGEYLHTVITGPPGVGKTCVSKIIGELYKNLGVLSSNGQFKIAKREDFVARYLGQTAIKTKKLLESCKGGVLFIDEAYALGAGEQGRDSFSKEALDTLNAFLSENKTDFCCIIAGYEKDLHNCFFKVNKGLESRFPWTHRIKKYSSEELALIFDGMVKNIKWRFLPSIKTVSEIIEKNKDLFENSGRDVETFLTKSKMAHARRVFPLSQNHKKILTREDLDNGIKLTNENRVQKRNDIPLGMYI